MRRLVRLALVLALAPACGDDDDALPPDAGVIGVPGTYAIAGTVSYEDRAPLPDGGLAAPSPKPVRGADIAVIAEDGGMTLAMGVVGDDGSYSLQFDAVGGAPMHVLVIAASTSAARPLSVVHPNQDVHGFGGATFAAGVDTTNDVLVTIASDEAGAFNIFDTLVEVMDRIPSAFNGTPAPLSALWEIGNSDGTYYLDGVHQIHLLGEQSDDDGFDDTVILHESGHYIEDVIGRSDSPGGSHDGTPTDPRLAWSEGWSTYFAMAMREQPLYMDSNSGGGFGYNGDTSVTKAKLNLPIGQQVSEDMVTEILWDMSDGAGGDDDMLDGTFDHVLAIEPFLRTAALRSTAGVTGVDLVDALDGFFVANGLTSCTGARMILDTTHTFPYDYGSSAGSCP